LGSASAPELAELDPRGAQVFGYRTRACEQLLQPIRSPTLCPAELRRLNGEV